MTRVCLTMMFAGSAFAQISGPVLGYLPEGGALRPMYGIPASGGIGAPLRAGGGFGTLAASPGGGFALASTDTGGVTVLLPVGRPVLQPVVVPGAIAGNIEFSPNGSAALISIGGGEIQVIGGLPSSPALLRTQNISFLGPAAALAVSDDGQWVAGVFGGQVYGLGPASQVAALPAPAGVTALAFFHGTRDLAATTDSQIVKISGIGGSAALSTIFASSTPPVPPESPIALALTSDNAWAVVLEPDGGIGEVGVADGAVRTTTCGCQPQGLFGLSGSAFRVNSLTGGSVKVYDAASGDVWFVPLARTRAEGGRP